MSAPEEEKMPMTDSARLFDGLMTALLNAEFNCGAYPIEAGKYDEVFDVRQAALKAVEDHVAQLRHHSASRERMEKALRNLLRHPIGVSTNAMDIAEARAALSAASQEGEAK